MREVAFTDLQLTMAVAMAETGNLPAGASINEARSTYAWFQSGTFYPDVLADPAIRNSFITWMNSGDMGDPLTRLLPDIAAQFDHGVSDATVGAR